MESVRTDSNIAERPTQTNYFFRFISEFISTSLRICFTAIPLGFAYLLGFYQLSFIWLALLVVSKVMLEMVEEIGQRKRELNKLISTLEDKELINRYFIKNLPQWVVFPDIERVEWLNKIIKQFWPYINKYTRTYIREDIEPKLRENLSSYQLSGFQFDQIRLGLISPKITGVKVYDISIKLDEIVMDINVFYGGDCNITCSVGGMQAGIKDFQIDGTLRLILKPLLPVKPLVGGVQLFFVNSPSLDFELNGLNGVLEYPGLKEIIKRGVEVTIDGICVLPNKLTFIDGHG